MNSDWNEDRSAGRRNLVHFFRNFGKRIRSSRERLKEGEHRQMQAAPAVTPGIAREIRRNPHGALLSGAEVADAIHSLDREQPDAAQDIAGEQIAEAALPAPESSESPHNVTEAPTPTRMSIALDEEVAAIVYPDHRYADFLFYLKQPTDFYFDGATDVDGLTWELLGPQGMLRYGIAFRETDGDRRDAMVHAQSAGRYLLRVRAAGMKPAALSFCLHDLSRLPAHPIAGRHAVSLTGTYRVRVLAFEAQAGDCFSYSPEQVTNGEAEMWLAEAGAASGMRRYQANVEMTAMLCRSARHYLFMSATKSNGRPVELNFRCELARSREMAVLLNRENSSVLASQQLTDAWAFTVSEKRRMLLKQTAGRALSVSLISEKGRELLRGADGQRPILMQLEPGRYRMIFSGNGSGGPIPGPYAFWLGDAIDARTDVELIRRGAVMPKLFPEESRSPEPDCAIEVLSGEDEPGHGHAVYAEAAGVKLKAFGGDNETGISAMFHNANLVGLTLDMSARAGKRTCIASHPAGGEPLRQRCRMRLDEPVTLVLERSGGNLVEISLSTREASEQAEGEDFGYGRSSRTLLPGEYLFVLDATDDPDPDALGCRLEVFDIAAAPQIKVGAVVGGQLDELRPTTVFRFDALAGQSFLLQNRQCVLDGGWSLIDPDGIRKFQLSQEASCSVPVEITKDGMHALVLERFGNIETPQSFSFTILPLEVTSASAVNRLSVAMQASRARALRLRMERDSWLLVSARDAALQCRFRKVGASGRLYDESWMRSLPHRGQMHRFPAGEYFLTVENGSDSAADFSFTKVAAAFATPIFPGLAVGGTLGGIDRFEQYSLPAEAGRRYRIDVRGATDIQWHLIDPIGRLMVSAEAGTPSDVLDFAVHGIYLIVLETAGTGHLDYSLQVADVLLEPSGFPYAYGPREPALLVSLPA